MSLLHQNDFSKMTRTKIVAILDAVIYKLELRLQVKDAFNFLDLPFIHPGVKDIEARDAFNVFKMLTDEFLSDGFSFPVQGIKQEVETASWNNLLKKLKILCEHLSSNCRSTNVSGLKIGKLVIVKSDHEGTLYKIVVNDLFDLIFEVSNVQSCWKLLYTVAAQSKIPIQDNNRKGDMHYINSNSGCKLYKKTHLSPTKILMKENGYIKAIVPIEVIDHATLKRRMSKKNQV